MAAGPTRSMEMLVFEIGGARFGVEARKVESVIAWRPPVPLPRAGTAVAGVIQDRGRIVSVLRHPAGAEGEPKGATRILVCGTEHGLIGLPAAVTRSVGPVELRDEPVSGVVVDSSERTLTYVDPEALVREILGGGA